MSAEEWHITLRMNCYVKKVTEFSQMIEDAYMQKQGFESLAEKTLSDLELRVDLKSTANVKGQTNTPYERLLLFCNGYPYLEGALLNRNESNNPKVEYKTLIRTTLDQALNISADYRRLSRSMRSFYEARGKEVESKRRA